jgi:hypothetical protein
MRPAPFPPPAPLPPGSRGAEGEAGPLRLHCERFAAHALAGSFQLAPPVVSSWACTFAVYRLPRPDVVGG